MLGHCVFYTVDWVFGRRGRGRLAVLKDAGAILFSQVDSLKHLLETGTSVNAPPDPHQQSPVHLAARGGLACFILWQLQMGADLNQQVSKPIALCEIFPYSPNLYTHFFEATCHFSYMWIVIFIII